MLSNKSSRRYSNQYYGDNKGKEKEKYKKPSTMTGMSKTPRQPAQVIIIPDRSEDRADQELYKEKVEEVKKKAKFRVIPKGERNLSYVMVNIPETIVWNNGAVIINLLAGVTMGDEAVNQYSSNNNRIQSIYYSIRGFLSKNGTNTVTPYPVQMTGSFYQTKFKTGVTIPVDSFLDTSQLTQTFTPNAQRNLSKQPTFKALKDLKFEGQVGENPQSWETDTLRDNEKAQYPSYEMIVFDPDTSSVSSGGLWLQVTSSLRNTVSNYSHVLKVQGRVMITMYGYTQ